MMKKVTKKVVLVLLIISICSLSTINIFASDIVAKNNMGQNKLQYGGTIIEDKSIATETESEPILIDEHLYEIINSPLTGTKELREAILKSATYSDGKVKKYEFHNIATFKAALEIKYPEMSELDLGKTILQSLGDSEDFIKTLPDEKIIEANGYLSVVRTESFYKQTADGEKIELSEDEYYTGITSLSTPQTATDNISKSDNSNSLVLSSPTHDQTETLDSYIKLTSTAYKTNPSYAQTGRNYFTIRGEVEWTDIPTVRGKDVLAIASSGNIDDDYNSYACAYWPYTDEFTYDYAYIGVNGGEGEVGFGDALKIYNPSIYGVAVDVLAGLLSGNGPALKRVYAYYGISTQDDVTCQVGYAHKTIGLSAPSVSIDFTGAISFSVGFASTMHEYFGEAFTLYHESYSVLLSSPVNNASITYNSNAPIFRWSLQSGNTQKFILEIDYLGNGTYKTISMSGGNTYQLSSTDWESIKNDAPFIGNGIKQIKWRIKINYSIYPNEAPYCTDWYTFTITGCPVTTQETLPIIAANNRYTEKVIYLDSGKYKDLYVTFATGGNRVIQTFGTKDTVLELYASDGAKLLEQADTDDNGYLNNALLSYNFTANVTYRIRVKFYSSSQYGNTKLTIVPTYNHDSYDSAYGTYGTTTVSWSLSNNRVALFRYKFDSDGLATFKMSASSNTYLYIIDPASTEIIAQYANSNYDVDNMYDDDSSGNYQAKITKRVQANKEYLVIISFYNPNTMSGEFSITSSLSPILIPMPI